MSLRGTLKTILITAIIAAIGLGVSFMAGAQAQIKLPEGAVLVNGGYADVTGDGIADDVYLLGKRAAADADFMSEHGLFIVDGKDGKTYEQWLGAESAGYPGSISFGRMNPDASVDMLIELPSGGSGGVTTVLPLTFESGKLKYIADIYLLNDGPKVDFVVNDNYKMVAKYEGIEYAIDLLNGKAKDTEGVYKGIFDESGRKVGTLKPAIDPVGASELVDLNSDGIFEIVTYRSIWAGIHANGVAFARSTWGWDNGSIKPRFVSVKQSFSPGNFLEYINAITATDPVEAMKLAVAKYLAGFEAASPYWRYEAFMILRTYQQAVAEKITAAFPPVQTADDATMKKVYEYSDRLSTVGVGVFYIGQGKIAALVDPKFELQKFEKYLPKDAVEFLLLEAVEVYDIWAMDGALAIQLEEIGNRLHDWEYFLQSYPRSPFANYAMNQYVSKLAAFLLGIDNSPNFSYTDGTINPGVIASLEKYVREFEGTPSANVISSALGIMREGKGKLTQQLIDRIIGLLPKPAEAEVVKP